VSTLRVKYVEEAMRLKMRKQRLTLSLNLQTIQNAKALADKRSTSVSDLFATQIEALLHRDEAYESAHRAALDLMERGFHLGGSHSVKREKVHSRASIFSQP
jgi:hypothetical protein